MKAVLIESETRTRKACLIYLLLHTGIYFSGNLLIDEMALSEGIKYDPSTLEVKKTTKITSALL
jgi:hypothetical protein